MKFNKDRYLATEAQREAMTKMDIPWDDTTTKAEAHKLISEAIEEDGGYYDEEYSDLDFTDLF